MSSSLLLIISIIVIGCLYMCYTSVRANNTLQEGLASSSLAGFSTQPGLCRDDAGKYPNWAYTNTGAARTDIATLCSGVEGCQGFSQSTDGRTQIYGEPYGPNPDHTVGFVAPLLLRKYATENTKRDSRIPATKPGTIITKGDVVTTNPPSNWTCYIKEKEPALHKGAVCAHENGPGWIKASFDETGTRQLPPSVCKAKCTATAGCKFYSTRMNDYGGCQLYTSCDNPIGSGGDAAYNTYSMTPATPPATPPAPKFCATEGKEFTCLKGWNGGTPVKCMGGGKVACASNDGANCLWGSCPRPAPAPSGTKPLIINCGTTGAWIRPSDQKSTCEILTALAPPPATPPATPPAVTKEVYRVLKGSAKQCPQGERIQDIDACINAGQSLKGSGAWPKMMSNQGAAIPSATGYLSNFGTDQAKGCFTTGTGVYWNNTGDYNKDHGSSNTHWAICKSGSAGGTPGTTTSDCISGMRWGGPNVSSDAAGSGADYYNPCSLHGNRFTGALSCSASGINSMETCLKSCSDAEKTTGKTFTGVNWNPQEYCQCRVGNEVRPNGPFPGWTGCKITSGSAPPATPPATPTGGGDGWTKTPGVCRDDNGKFPKWKEIEATAGKTLDEIKAECLQNAACQGFAKGSGTDYYQLFGDPTYPKAPSRGGTGTTITKGSATQPNYDCYIKSGASGAGGGGGGSGGTPTSPQSKCTGLTGAALTACQCVENLQAGQCNWGNWSTGVYQKCQLGQSGWPAATSVAGSAAVANFCKTYNKSSAAVDPNANVKQYASGPCDPGNGQMSCCVNCGGAKLKAVGAPYTGAAFENICKTRNNPSDCTAAGGTWKVDPNTITSEKACTAAGGKSYAYCSTNDVHYCAGPCTGEQTCTGNTGLKNNACAGAQTYSGDSAVKTWKKMNIKGAEHTMTNGTYAKGGENHYGAIWLKDGCQIERNEHTWYISCPPGSAAIYAAVATSPDYPPNSGWYKQRTGAGPVNVSPQDNGTTTNITGDDVPTKCPLDYACPAKFHRKSPMPATCPDAGCEPQDCCEPNTYCSTMGACPTGRQLKPGAANIMCAGAECQDKECCEPIPHEKCDNFPCPKNYSLKSGATNITCAATTCADEECCVPDPKPTCGTDPVLCPYGYENKPDVQKIACETYNCTEADCCISEPPQPNITDIKKTSEVDNRRWINNSQRTHNVDHDDHQVHNVVQNDPRVFTSATEISNPGKNSVFYPGATFIIINGKDKKGSAPNTYMHYDAWGTPKMPNNTRTNNMFSGYASSSSHFAGPVNKDDPFATTSPSSDSTQFGPTAFNTDLYVKK